MLKTLLSGTAVAALLVAGPVYAQTTSEPPPQPETQMQDSEATGVEDEAGAHSQLEEEDNLETDAADSELESDTDTAQDDMDTGTDTAQDPMGADTGTDTAVVDEEPAETYFAEQLEDEILASELMNASVENAEGELLGSINDVLVSEEEGVKGVVIGVGGFLGLGQKNVAVNYEEIDHVRDEYGNVTLQFNATAEELEEAPEFRNLQQQIADAELQQMQTEQAPAAPPAGGGGMAQ